MKRKAKILRKNDNGNRIICIDIENQDEILAYIEQDKRHRKKFLYISDIILLGLTNTDLYDKEEIDNRSKNVTAMKFFKKNENDRIYCKEIEEENRTLIIIMSVLLEKKKNQKVKQREKNAIHKVGGYEYELEE